MRGRGGGGVMHSGGGFAESQSKLNSKHFSVAHLNVRSLNTGFDDLRNYFNEYNFDIVGVSETWLSSDHNDSAFGINGYNFIRKDRDGRGGGVGIYIKKHFQYQNIQFDIPTDICEIISIKFKLNKKHILFINIYRAPSLDTDNFIDTLSDLMSMTMPFYDCVIFSGDFNIDFLGESRFSSRITNLIDTFNLAQHITQPTRITDTSSTLIDVIIANINMPCICSHSLAISEELSDHCLVYSIFNLKTLNNCEKYIEFRDYDAIALDEFEEDAVQLPWYQVFYISDINEKLQVFNDYILYLVNKHAPIKRKKIRERPFMPWITSNI